MADILRPTFGKPKPEEPDASHWLPIEGAGQAAGYDVGLIRDRCDRGPMIRVVIDPTGGDAI